MTDRRRGTAGRELNLAILGGALVMPFTFASAQPVGDFERLGIRTEQWNVFPSLSLSATYDDNVFAVPDDSPALDSDVFFVLAPSVTLQANTTRHALAFSGGAQIGRYADLTDQNFNDFNFGANGRWDVTRTFDVNASFSFARTAEDQADPDRTRVGAEPFERTTIDSFSGGLAARKDWQRTFASASVDVRRRTFEELEATVFEPAFLPVLVPQGTVNVNEDRDRFVIPFNFRVGYDVDRDYNVFMNVGYRLVRFDEPRQVLTTVNGIVTDVREGDSRDFDTLSVRVGTGLDFDRLVTGEFSIGITRRSEDTDDEDDEFGFSFDADLDWTLSPRTSLNVSGSQDFEPATGDGADGSALRTRVGLGLDYAVSRQVSVGGDFAYLRDERGDDGSTDDDITAGVSASYAINRFASVSANYQFRRRTSTDENREFERNRVFLTVTGRY